jgi:P-type Cu+ transporter
MEETYGLQDYGDNQPTLSVDPVCGMNVNEAEAPGGKANYAGQQFFFCSTFCRKNFELDPAKYIGQPTRP